VSGEKKKNARGGQPNRDRAAAKEKLCGGDSQYPKGKKEKKPARETSSKARRIGKETYLQGRLYEGLPSIGIIPGGQQVPWEKISRLYFSVGVEKDVLPIWRGILSIPKTARLKRGRDRL